MGLNPVQNFSVQDTNADDDIQSPGIQTSGSNIITLINPSLLNDFKKQLSSNLSKAMLRKISKNLKEQVEEEKRKIF